MTSHTSGPDRLRARTRRGRHISTCLLTTYTPCLAMDFSMAWSARMFGMLTPVLVLIACELQEGMSRAPRPCRATLLIPPEGVLVKYDFPCIIWEIGIRSEGHRLRPRGTPPGRRTERAAAVLTGTKVPERGDFSYQDPLELPSLSSRMQEGQY